MLYDHQTESLWSQLLEKSVSGSLVGKDLNKIASSRTSWKVWKKRHPHTLVLSNETGYTRDYSRDPYTGYYRVGTIWFPVGEVRQDLSPKERVMGVEVKNEARAYPLKKLQKKSGSIEDTIGGETIRIEVSAEGEVLAITNGRGEEVPHIFVFWFAWQTFHPDTTIYRGGE